MIITAELVTDYQNSTMSAFGENLRREREMRGVTLEEISSATKISLRFLDAIERDDFGKLPGGIFVRSFIRSYARYLGLDEERVVADFQAVARPQTDFDLHRMAAGNPNALRPVRRTPLVGTAVAVALLVAGYLLFRYAARTAEAPAAAAITLTPKPQGPSPSFPPAGSGTAVYPGANAAGEVPAGTAPGTPAGAAESPNPRASTVPGPNVQPSSAAPPPTETKPASESELVLQVAATERVWVAVDADGRTVLQRPLNPKEVETLKAHKSFDVTTGSAQSIVLTLNGETLKPLGRRNEVKSIHLTREDVKSATAP